MVWIASLVFLGYSALAFYDEFYFHRRRTMPHEEKFWRRTHALFLTLTFSYPIFFNESWSALPAFGLLAGGTLVAAVFAEKTPGNFIPGHERVLHTVQAMWHPVLLILLTAIWFFIDGVNPFLNALLPISMTHLREACEVSALAFGVLFFVKGFELRPRQSRLGPTAKPVEPPVSVETRKAS